MGFLTKEERYGNIIMENEKKYVVISFPMQEYGAHEIRNFVEHVSSLIDLPVIVIPHDFSWREMSLDQLKQMRDLIDKVIIPSREDQENDTNS